VVRIDDVVTELKLDVLDGADLQVLQQLLFDGFGNDVLLGLAPALAGLSMLSEQPCHHVCR
jgi:hypothetical protein